MMTMLPDTAMTINNRLIHKYTRLMLVAIICCIVLDWNVNLSLQQQAGPNYEHKHQHRLHYQEQQTEASKIRHKILIPDMPTDQYQYWLRNHPLAREGFKIICSHVAENPNVLDSLSDFQHLHANLSLENHEYLENLEIGREILTFICSKIHLIGKSCWGYENGCDIMYLMPECPSANVGNRLDDEKKIKWFTQADFGYIHDLRLELSKYCSPEKKLLKENRRDVSLLECTNHFATCRGEDLFMHINLPDDIGHGIDFKSANIFKAGDIGGWNCDLQLKQMDKQQGHNGQLEAWYNELKNYRQVGDKQCDFHETKQTYFVKMDSPLMMYDYLSSFINLYATMHFNNKFSQNNQIIIWDSISPVNSGFEEIWSAFTSNKLLNLDALNGTRACFEKFIFALPPRTIDGLMHRSLNSDCKKSGLIAAFSKHVLHRLKIMNPYNRPASNEAEDLIRVTILNRSNDKLRAIVNEKDFINAIRKKSNRYLVKKIDHGFENFRYDLELIHHTDILIGIHNDELTYSLFLPDWASVVELHDCGDKKYESLARMRGVDYFTHQDPKTKNKLVEKVPVLPGTAKLAHLNRSSSHKDDKFCNYKVNIDEFMVFFEEIVRSTKKNRAKYFGISPNASDEQVYVASSEPPATEATTETISVTFSPASLSGSNETRITTSMQQAIDNPMTTTNSTTTSSPTPLRKSTGILDLTSASNTTSTTISAQPTQQTTSEPTTTPSPPNKNEDSTLAIPNRSTAGQNKKRSKDTSKRLDSKTNATKVLKSHDEL